MNFKPSQTSYELSTAGAKNQNLAKPKEKPKTKKTLTERVNLRVSAKEVALLEVA